MPFNVENYNAGNFEQTQFCRTFILSCKFILANLKGANFSECRLDDCDFSNAKLDGADFTEAVFQDMDLSKVDFTKAKLTKARFANVNFFDKGKGLIPNLNDLRVKYENHPDFEVLRKAILNNFLEQIDKLECLSDRISILKEGLNNRLFGRPRTWKRRWFNSLFAEDGYTNYASNAIWTSSQRIINKK